MNAVSHLLDWWDSMHRLHNKKLNIYFEESKVLV